MNHPNYETNIAILNEVKASRTPQEEYSIHAGVSPDTGKFIIAIYKKVPIYTKKYGREIAETHIALYNDTKREEAIDFMNKYTNPRIL